MNTKFQFTEALKDKGWSKETFIKKYNKKLKEMYPRPEEQNAVKKLRLTYHKLESLFENPMTIKTIERALFPALLDISHEDLEKIFPIKI